MTITDKRLDKPIADHLAAVNAFDIDGIVAPFTEDAFVNDAPREFRGRRRHQGVGRAGDGWRQSDHRRAGSRGQLRRHHRPGAYDGQYDKTNLPPGDLILSNYFGVRDGKITSLIVIRNEPAVLR